MNFENEYKKTVDMLKPSEKFKESLFKVQEGRTMKFDKKKFAIIAAAATMAIGTTAFAAGGISYYTSSSSPKDAITDYSEAMSKADELGCESIPEAFSNGYTFENANTMDVNGMSESGKVMVTSTDFTADYVKDDMPDIHMFVNHLHETEDNGYAVESKMIGDVEVYFNRVTYKFVPAGYELTEEDEKNMEDPHFELSCGTDEIEIMENTGVSFQKGDKLYNMFAWDSEMTSEEWYAMAEELLAE